MGTRIFMAPELIEGSKNYDNKIDIWGVGCVFCLMITGKIPLNGGNNNES